MNYLVTKDDFLCLFQKKAIKGWLKGLSWEEFRNALKHFKPYYHTLPEQIGLQHLFFKLFFFGYSGYRRIDPELITPRSGDVFLIVSVRAHLKKEYGQRKFQELCEEGKIGLYSFSVIEVYDNL